MEPRPEAPNPESRETLEESVTFWMGLAFHYWETCLRQRTEIARLKAGDRGAPFPEGTPLDRT